MRRVTTEERETLQTLTRLLGQEINMGHWPGLFESADALAQRGCLIRRDIACPGPTSACRGCGRAHSVFSVTELGAIAMRLGVGGGGA